MSRISLFLYNSFAKSKMIIMVYLSFGRKTENIDTCAETKQTYEYSTKDISAIENSKHINILVRIYAIRIQIS